jgi:hypothetical protein
MGYRPALRDLPELKRTLFKDEDIRLGGWCRLAHAGYCQAGKCKYEKDTLHVRG